MKNIRKGSVRVNGSRVHCSERLQEGDSVTIPWGEPSFISDEGRSFQYGKLNILFQDQNIALINKPPGLLSQPSEKGGDSVITRFWSHMDKISCDFRPALANRLDRNTSGAVLLAMNGNALRILNEMIRKGRVVKRYLAVVAGSVPSKGRINASLQKDPTTNQVYVNAGGKSSVTLYRRLYGSPDISLVELELVTGRSHQARVHLSHIGSPILGDIKYGKGQINDIWRREGIKRPMLHAWEIGFKDLPRELSYLSGRSFRASLPDDFIKIFQSRSWEPVD